MDVVLMTPFLGCVSAMVYITGFVALGGPGFDSDADIRYVMDVPPYRSKVRGSGGVVFYGSIRPHTELLVVLTALCALDVSLPFGFGEVILSG